MRLKPAYSTCPNDTYLFDALVNRKIASQPYEFIPSLADISELNKIAKKGEADIVKISFFAYPEVSEQYQILDTGSALGRGCGPLLVGRDSSPPDINKQCKIAIPGKNTTANLLLSLAYPELHDKEEYLFSEIEQAVADGLVDYGLIIHESRFTYQEKGLQKIRDLGQFWEETTGLPIALGGLAIIRDLPETTKKNIDKLLKASLLYANDNKGSTEAYIKKHAAEMDREVCQRHIELYVNDYTYSLGSDGRSAIRRLLKEANSKNLCGSMKEPIFVIE